MPTCASGAAPTDRGGEAFCDPESVAPAALHRPHQDGDPRAWKGDQSNPGHATARARFNPPPCREAANRNHQ